MRKSFKQVSTGLILVCEREDVIKQYEKYPDLYIPMNDARNKKSSRPVANKAPEPKADDAKPEANASDKQEK